MKILIILDVIDSGGVTTVLRNLLRHIDLCKYRITLLVFEENEEYEKMLPQNLVIRHVYKKNPAKSKSRILRYLYGGIKEWIPKWLLRRIVIRDSYDVAIDFKGNNLNVLSAADCPKIFWSHKDFSPETNPIEKKVIEVYSKTVSGRFKERRFKRHLSRLDRVVCISEAAAEAFCSRWGYTTDKIEVLYNILDVEDIQQKARQYVPYYKKDVLTFCCMSRITKGKGIEKLLYCTKELSQQGYQFEVDIVGGGDAYDLVKGLAEELGLKNVRFFGNQINPYPYVAHADVFIYPSETEAYSMAVCEALVLGKAIIVTNTVSVPEIFEHGKYGMVVENSQEGIFDGMKRILDDNSLVDTYSQLAAERIDHFEITRRLTAVERFLDEFKKGI